MSTFQVEVPHMMSSSTSPEDVLQHSTANHDDPAIDGILCRLTSTGSAIKYMNGIGTAAVVALKDELYDGKGAEAQSADSDISDKSKETTALERNFEFNFSIKQTTMMIVQVKNLLSSPVTDLGGIKVRITTVFSAVVNSVHNEKGAVHQFFGDMAVCVWHAANQQVRACTAILQIVETCANDPSISGAPIHAAVTSGPMSVGSVGLHHRMPVFYGAPQVFCHQLHSLCPVIGARILVDQNVASQVEHQFDLIAVDCISECAFSLPVSQVYELCCGYQESRTSEGEWMYQISGSSPSNVFKQKYLEAFTHYSEGRPALAAEELNNLLAQIHSADCCQLASCIFVQHVKRLISECRSHNACWKPLRRVCQCWGQTSITPTTNVNEDTLLQYNMFDWSS
jgi:hypothetical protein